MATARMFAAVTLGLTLVLFYSNQCLGQAILERVVVNKATAITSPLAGGNTVEIHATLTIRNGGAATTGVSPRQYAYSLVRVAADGTEGDPQMFFGIEEPELRDSQPLEPGKTVELVAPLAGHTIGIEKTAKYRLLVKETGQAGIAKRVEILFK